MENKIKKISLDDWRNIPWLFLSVLKKYICKKRSSRIKIFLKRNFAAIFVTVAILFSMSIGIGTKAFIFEGQNEIAEIYPLEADGDWENYFQAMMLPEAGEKDGEEDFDGSNSAIYEGGSRSVILSSFGATRDELENLSEDDEIMINDLHQPKDWNENETQESALEQEVPAVDLPENVEGTEEEVLKENEENNEGAGAEGEAVSQKKSDPSFWQELARIFLGKEVQARKKVGFIDLADKKFVNSKIKMSFAIAEKPVGEAEEENISDEAVPVEMLESAEENYGSPAEENSEEPKNMLEIAALEGTKYLNARSEPSLESEVVGKVQSGETFEYIEEKDGWYKIRINAEKEGWISAEFVIIPGGAADENAAESGDVQDAAEETGADVDQEGSGILDLSNFGKFLKEKFSYFVGAPEASAKDNVGAGETHISENTEFALDTDIDAKIIVWYSLDGEWKKLDVITQLEASNLLNGGYFSFDAPFLQEWRDLMDLQIKLEGVVGGETNFTAYLDSAWVEVEYQDYEKKDPKMHSQKKSWRGNENPKFIIDDLKEEESIFGKISEIFSSSEKDNGGLSVEVKLTDPKGETFELAEGEDFVVDRESSVEVEILAQNDMSPGKYAMEISSEYEGISYDFEEEFFWGVLAVNVNKSIYLENETAYVQLAALDSAGHTLCDADLEVEIRNPGSETKIFKTEDGSIQKSDSCGPDNVTDNPDYYFHYQVGAEGDYEMRLKNIDNGYEIFDSFEARDTVPFEVERVGATRINPFKSAYVMTLKIKADRDFQGKIIETVPDSFEINDQSSIFNFQSISDDAISKQLVWKVDLKKGESYELKYEYQASQISPALFLLGPLKISSQNEALLRFLGADEEKVIFEEARGWQIASDAQFARPDSDITTTGIAGGTYEAINETSPVDTPAGTEFVYGNENTAVTYEVGLSNVTDPGVHTGHTFRYRIVSLNDTTPSTNATVYCTASLYQGGTLIKADSQKTTTATWTTYTLTLSEAEAANITDYTDLRLRFVSPASGGSASSRRALGLSWAELEVPDAPVINVTVSASGTQTATMSVNSTNQYVGGKFAIVENSSSRNVTGITITEQGTVDAQADLDNIKLYYENDTSSPYDCTGESYGGTESQFGSTDTDGFNAANGTSAFTGSVGISTTSSMCVYVVLDVGSGSSNGETLEIQISNPSTDVTVSSGTIEPATAVAISGTTILDVFLASGSSNMRTGSTVRVVIDGTLDTSHTGTISATDGTWSVPLGTVDRGDSVIVFVEDAEGNESTAVTIYDGGGDIEGMVLDQNTLSIGSDDSQEISLSDLDDFQNSSNENVMHSVASSALTIDGGSSYADETLKVLAKNTLIVGGTETINAHNIEINTTGKLEAKGNSTFNVSGSLLGAGGSFAYASSTVNFTSSGDAEDISLGAGNIFLNDKVDKTTGTNPSSVASGDLNNDGWVDLAVANVSSGTISTFSNNGDGTFADKVDKTTGTSSNSIAIGDLNNDGWTDLATVSYASDTVSTFINNGDGTFADKVDKITGDGPNSVAIGDFNNDGWADLAVANSGSNTVSTFQNNGNGTFADKVDKTTGSLPRFVAIGDLNNDGWADLAVVNSSSDTVSTFQNNGDGTFANKVDKITGDAPYSVAIGDLNNNGWADLAVVNSSSDTVSIFQNNGDGTFADKADKIVGDTPGFIVIGDLNNDGWDDLAVTHNIPSTVSVLKNNGDGTFADEVYKTTGSNPQSATIGDFDNDGWKDLAVTNYTSNTVSTFINNSNGTFANKVDKTAGSSPSSVVTGDFNNDNWNDLAVANQTSDTISIFINNGNGTFADKVDKTAGDGSRSIDAADLNNDGWTDLAVVNQNSNSVSVFQNNGNGTFADKVDKTTGTLPQDVTIGDFNNDNWNDLAVANSSTSDTISIFINNGNGTFADKVDKTTGDGPRSIDAADLNNDGWVDVVSGNTTAGTLSIFQNNGDGTFADKVDKSASGPYSVTISDLNNDGWRDLAVATYSSSKISIYLNNGDGTFADNVDKSSEIHLYSIRSGDINKDGWNDLVVTNTDNDSISIFLNNGDGTFADKVDKTSGDFLFGLAIGDINNDGWDDLAVTSYVTSGLVCTHLNSGTNGKFNHLNIGSSGSGTWNLKTSIEAKGNIAISNGTLAVNEDLTIFAGGNWSNSGSFTPDIGTVEFTKSSGTQTLNSGGTGSGKIFNNLIHRGAGTLQLLTNAANIDGDFTNYFGTFDANSLDQAYAGDFFNIATFTPGTSTSTLDGSSSQLIRAGGQSFSTLTLNNSGSDGAKDDIIVSGALDVNSAFNITNGDLRLNASNSTINTAGNVTIGSSAFVTKGTGTWTFDGTTSFTDSSTAGPQNIGLASVTGTSLTLASSMVADKMTVSAGTLALGSSGYTLTLAGSGTGTSRPLYMNGGTLSEGTNSTIKFTGTTALDIQNETYYHLNLSPSGGSNPDYTLATSSSQTITAQNLTIGDGTNTVSVTAATNAPTLDINGNLLINSGGTLIASDIAPFTIAGNWTNSGSFTHSSGTITLDGVNQSFTGNTTFNNLTKQEMSNDATDSILTFAQSSTQTIAGTFNFDGLDSDDRVNLVSSSPATRYTFDFASAQSATWLDVTDSNASTSSITCTDNCVNGGNNDNTEDVPHWIFAAASGITVSGTVYTDEAKTTPIADGRTVHLFVNSTDYSTTTTSTGDYSFSTVTVTAGDSVIVYLDGVAEDGSVVTLALDGTTAISDLDIITGHVSLEHRATGPITNADLDDIDAVDAGNEDGITISSPNAVFADGFELYVLSGETYTPGGTVECDDFELEGAGSFIPNANAVTVSGDWEMSSSGTFTTSGTVTFDGTTSGLTIIDGGSAFHDLVFSGTGGEWLYVDGATTSTNSTSVSAGIATLLNVKTGTVSVTGGTLNVDWYLGTHVVSAVNTGTNIDTGEADIAISEASSASAVWRHNGTSWGSAASSQTTGTASSGINPQPNADGAIRIREYSMTASATCPGAGCTLYKYNEQIDWVGTYGEYDYYDDYGQNYLISCLAGSTSACSDDTADDDTIGVGWYRSAIGTINTPYSTVNIPPTQGSWYVGMLEAINFSIDTYSRDFGILTPGGGLSDLTNTLTVTTSATNGYTIYAREEQPMTCSESAVCGTADIDNWSGTNEIPSTWNAGSYGFGYSTNDYALEAGEGSVDRFSGPKFSGFIATGFGDPVVDRSGPSSAQENTITYRISASGEQAAGLYQTSIYYVVSPMY